ncbi:tetratricopeptide repeat protein [Flavobacterium rhizosphaerae]|uniref:Tetratricopeptide repeat protein n=1 Tax=Flavobacterium rhizosphaerae TaxID=3163298 RepID=A0ABW8YYH0_9FLAO
MKKIFLYIFFLLAVTAFAQNEQLALNYFEKGEFEKAAVIYKELEQKQPYNFFYAQRLAACYQQLQEYDKATALLSEKLEKTKQPLLLVELGYNYQLQDNMASAQKYYDQAIDAITQNPSAVYGVADAFEKKVLVDQALKAYKTATAINPNMNFDYQMALLEGQLGHMDLMTERLLDYAYNNQRNLIVVQHQLTRFMEEETDGSNFNDLLRKALLVKAQKNQDIFWNQFLSWFFVQQKDYNKAFVQEKAIYRRDPNMFMNIVSLGKIALEENEKDTAREIYSYILENTTDQQLLAEAHYNLLNLDIEAATEKDYEGIKQRIDALLADFGITPYSLDLQLIKAKFQAFYLKDTQAATATLNRALELQLNKYQQAKVKMELSDVLLLDSKFNQAIIYYAQIEEDLKNDAVGHEASLKMARASYFKGDFDWAQKQLKVLKSSSSQLIANDALELFLLITDNTVEDSTQVALKKFAKADFLLYQNKKAEALASFKQLLDSTQTESIKDVTLLRMGRIYEGQGKYDFALQQYKQIIDNFTDGIYIDEALFFSAEIYNKQLHQPEEAKPLYEKLLFGHEDSIYFIEARKQFRLLRGDAVNS